MLNKNVYIILGEEFILKEDKINSMRSTRLEWNYKKIILENSKKETLAKALNECFVFLVNLDMFNLNNKILHVVVDNLEMALGLLKELMDVVEDNILIIDIRSNESRGLLSNKFYKNNSSNIEVLKFNKLEEKTRKTTIEEIKVLFSENNVYFETKEDEDICANYIYDNSNYSYSSIRLQVEQLKYLNETKLTKSIIYDFINQSFNGNFYVLIDLMFSSINKIEMLKLLEHRFVLFDNSDYIRFSNILNSTLKDYLRYSKKIKCKNGANYYKFKNSNLTIKDVERFILDVSNLSFKLRVVGSETSVKEELLMIIWKYFD